MVAIERGEEMDVYLDHFDKHGSKSSVIYLVSAKLRFSGQSHGAVLHINTYSKSQFRLP